jgi:hypothetical protein
MSFEFPVERGAVLSFARAIGDLDPRWWDDSSPEAKAHGGVAAPPTFVASVAQWDPDWPYRPRADQPWWGSGKDGGTPPPSSGTGTSLHAEQHYAYHRPLRPGDVLHVTREAGRTWEKHSSRAGLLRFEEEITRFTDEQGEPVVTATRVRVVTERPVGT